MLKTHNKCRPAVFVKRERCSFLGMNECYKEREILDGDKRIVGVMSGDERKKGRAAQKYREV